MERRGRKRSNPDYKNSTGRKRKRYFRGNKYVHSTDNPRAERAHQRSIEELDTSTSRPTSASSKKIKQSTQDDISVSETSYRLVDFNILLPSLAEHLKCKCGGKVTFQEKDTRGLGFKLTIVCSHCSEDVEVSSSKQVGPKQNIYEVNRRSVFAMRMLGQGLAGLQTFCGIMDLPKPVTQPSYDLINKSLAKAAQEVCDKSMHQAVLEEQKATPSTQAGLDVSGDGTWRTPGFSSLQGAATLIGNKTGKAIDVAVRNSYCKACEKWKDKKETEEYQEWFENHKSVCPVNHEESAGKMEVNGIVEMFQQAPDKYGVKYLNYIGDGDSKVFKQLSDVKPYGDNFIINKKEDINHVGKRMGRRLRNRKKEFGKHVLSDNKTIGGRGRLTGKLIDDLSKYYSKAIRDNSESVSGMKNGIWATFYHKRSTDEEPQHDFCPSGTSSWCNWQKAKANKQLSKFQHKSSVPPAVMDAIKVVYEELSEESLLTRCLGAFSQNANECLNSVIWKLVPKKSFSGAEILKIGVFTAVSIFNDGASATLKIMHSFDTAPGENAVQYARNVDEKRIYASNKRTEASTYEARTARRTSRHRAEDDSYEGGAH